jgi:hypothetical protein
VFEAPSDDNGSGCGCLMMLAGIVTALVVIAAVIYAADTFMP